MANDIEWIAIKKFRTDPIGAVGFIGNDAVSVVAFFDDNDANKDGKVSWGEWGASKILFDMQGAAVTEVAMQARVEMDVIMRDPSFNKMAMNLFAEFAGSLIAQGIYIAYFKGGVKLVGGGIAKQITSSMVKQIVIRKGFEAAAKKAFMASTT